MKVQRSKVKEEKSKQEKKAKEAAKAYEDWKNTINYRPRRGSTGLSSEREPWKPVRDAFSLVYSHLLKDTNLSYDNILRLNFRIFFRSGTPKEPLVRLALIAHFEIIKN